jgi:hypothetical protein
VVAIDPCPSVACTRWIGAPRSSAWLARACRSQWLLTSAAIPARWLAFRKIGVTRERSSGFPDRDAKHRRVQPRGALQGRELAPYPRRQQNNARAASLAENEDLPGFAAGLKIAPSLRIREAGLPFAADALCLCPLRLRRSRRPSLTPICVSCQSGSSFSCRCESPTLRAMA